MASKVIAGGRQSGKTLAQKQAAKRGLQLGQRLVLAMRHAGLSSGQLERLLLSDRRRQREAGVVDRWLVGERSIAEVDVLAIARLCRVDPRWLATGRISPAATAALAKLQPFLDSARDAISPEMSALAREIVTFAEEPRRHRGLCRYCDCTFDAPCLGGCAWVDDEETICTACLLPAEVHDV